MKKRITGENCYGVVGGKMTRLEVGSIVECSENAFGSKAETVSEDRKLEVATPKKRGPKPKTESEDKE